MKEIILQNIGKKIVFGFFIRNGIEIVSSGELRYIGDERFGVILTGLVALDIRFDVDDIRSAEMRGDTLDIHLR